MREMVADDCAESLPNACLDGLDLHTDLSVSHGAGTSVVIIIIYYCALLYPNHIMFPSVCTLYLLNAP